MDKRLLYRVKPGDYISNTNEKVWNDGKKKGFHQKKASLRVKLDLRTLNGFAVTNRLSVPPSGNHVKAMA